MNIIWNKDFELGIPLIDKQHHFFVDTLNELISIIDDPQKSRQKLEQVFVKVEQYISLHFRTEENYFDKFNYPDASIHKAEHVKFRKKTQEIKKNYLEDNVDASFSLADYLENWLVNHLMTMDKKYVSCFHAHGL